MWENELKEAIIAGLKAKKAIMAIYEKGFDVEIKEDNSPVTLADKTADKIIREHLHNCFPNHAFLTEESEDNEILRSGDQTIWGDGQGSGSSLTAVPSSRVNINSADRDLLMSLPGIGAVTADAIIEYRSQRSFASIEEIMNVSGIGEAKYNAIKDLICV